MTASKQIQDGTESAWKQSSATCMKLISAKCTVENSWWAEKMPKNVDFYNRMKLGVISAYAWLFQKKSITMHGNMNEKFITPPPKKK